MFKKLINIWNEYQRKKNVPTSGFHAARQGYKFDDNPYPKNTPLHSIWRDDWLFEQGRFK